jgi:hypothetical protein
VWSFWTWQEIIPSGIWSPASSRNLRTLRKISSASSGWLNSEDSGRTFAETLLIFYCITWPHIPRQFHWTTAPESNRQCKRTAFEPGKLRLISQKIKVLFIYVIADHKTLKLYPSTEQQLFQPKNPFSISKYFKRIVICSKPSWATFKIAYLNIWSCSLLSP